MEQALDRVSKAASDGYPPYNIERVPRTDHDPERLRITLAVAGFTLDQLDVMLEENQLVVRGRQVDDKTRHYLHRGIAARQFQRAFLLADGMEVVGADLSDGLLSIDLTRPEPERIVRKIAIASRDP
ncbi:MAG TPA: Hsp20 family protein [Methylobacterium sp.]